MNSEPTYKIVVREDGEVIGAYAKDGSAVRMIEGQAYGNARVVEVLESTPAQGVVGWSAEDACEAFIAAEVDSAPNALCRLGDWLNQVLDEDRAKTASRMVLRAMLETSDAVRACMSASARTAPAEGEQVAISAGDAVFSFAALLTSLPHVVPFGAAAWATPGVDLATAFNVANGLTVSRDFPQGLKFPEIEGDLLDRIKQASTPATTAPVVGDESTGDDPPGYEQAKAEFVAHFVKNYPGPDTIISQPQWHAPRLFRAAYAAINRHTARPAKAEGDALCSACKGAGEVMLPVPTYDPQDGYDSMGSCPVCGGTGSALPRSLEDLRYFTLHCISASNEGVDYAVPSGWLDAMTTLGIMEKTGRGKWTPTEQARAVVAILGADTARTVSRGDA